MWKNLLIIIMAAMLLMSYTRSQPVYWFGYKSRIDSNRMRQNYFMILQAKNKAQASKEFDDFITGRREGSGKIACESRPGWDCFFVVPTSLITKTKE